MCDKDKTIFYNNRVLIGYWYDAMKLQEYKLTKFLSSMNSGDLLLVKYRKMIENLNSPVVLTQSSSSIEFGATISLLAPHIAVSPSNTQEDIGVILCGRLTVNELKYTQELVDGCHIVGLANLDPCERSAFVITSADYCNRKGDLLKYNQEFMLVLSASMKNGRKSLYIRYDPDPFPGVSDGYSLYLSHNPVSSSRWRILPIQRNGITRFEQEGKPVLVNTDIVINHCSTNINLGITPNKTAMGFFKKIYIPQMKTSLDIFKCELPHNIWQIYIPIAK